MGPHFKRLVLEKMAKDAIPDGGGLAAGVAFLSDPKRIGAGYKAAEQWARQAVDVMRSAPDNPHGTDEEAIAGAILQALEKKRAERRRRSG